MSRFEIKMPKLGESITEGTIISWSVQVGDIIKEDDAADGPTPEDLAKAATVPGVSWSASNRAWVARIGVRGERIALGSYRHLDDAIAAREEAEAVYGRPRRGRSASSKNSDEPGDGK